MQRHTGTEWAERQLKNLFRADQLNIAPRLILSFVFIILLMLGTDAVVLSQFHLVRAQAERLNGIDQKRVAVLRVYTSLLAFYDRLEALAESEDATRIAAEAGSLRTAVLEDTQLARASLSHLPSDLQQDPMIVGTLPTIQIALPAQ